MRPQTKLIGGSAIALFAVILYLLAVFGPSVDPCTLRAQDPAGSGVSTVPTFLPPGTDCRYVSPGGAGAGVVHHRWSWSLWVVLALLVWAGVLLWQGWRADAPTRE